MAGLFVEASTQTIAMGSGSLALANVNGATLCAWVYPNAIAAGNHSVYGLSNGVAAGSSRAKLGIGVGGTIRGNGRCLDADANQDFSSPGGFVTTGSWQFIAATFDYPNDLIRVYYNNTLAATSGVVTWGAPPTSNTASLSHNIGSQHGGGSEYFNGYIDDARCYNRVLSLAEIQSIYALRGVDRIFYGLQHRYMMREGASRTIISATAGSVKDQAVIRQDGASVNSPVYAESLLRARRKIIYE